METKSNTANLLWTGGWDSTFRLLQLLILQNRSVQPHYIIDADRKSTYAELLTIRNIKKEIFIRYPDATERLFPIIISDRFDLPVNPQISEAFHHIQEKFHFGSQYEWLAGYCSRNGSHNFEIGITKGGHTSKIIQTMIVKTGNDDDINYHIDDQFQGTDEYFLLGWYHFPLLDFTKQKMQQVAEQNGLLDIMQMTWFCHHPTPKNKPCGICVPCSLVVKKGMGWRLPYSSRIKYYLFKDIKRVYTEKIRPIAKRKWFF